MKKMTDINNIEIIKNNKKKGSTMYGTAAHNIYAQNDIGIESPTKLIEMMYEGVLRFNAQAKKSIRDNNIEKKFYWANRSIAIITELVAVLDPKANGDMTEYLTGLYNHQIHSLSLAATNNDIGKVDEVSGVFKGLLEAWRETTNVAN